MPAKAQRGRAWAFQRALLGSHFVCGAPRPGGLRPPGVVAHQSMVLPARVLSWPTSLVPHRAAQNTLVLASQAHRGFYALCSQRSPQPLDREAPWALSKGEGWRRNRRVKQRGMGGMWTPSLRHQPRSNSL